MRLSHFFLITLLSLMSILPLRVLHFLGTILAYFLFLFPNSLRATTFTNLSLCFPQKLKKEILYQTKLSLIETSKNFFELGKSWVSYPLKGVDSIVDIKGLDGLKKSLDLNHGVILFTPHLGNIEILINYLASNFACTIPYTKVKTSAAEVIIKKARTAMGANMVSLSTAGIRTLLKTLNGGGLLAIACDQVPYENGGLISNFFKVPARTISLVAKLANKVNCPCHSICCVRNKRSEGFTIYISNSIGEINSSNLNESVNLMNREIEKCIMRAPEQYAWEYKRFKHSIFKNPYK